MAPTTARTTRVRRVWLVCVVGGWAKEPTPVTARDSVPTEPRMTLGADSGEARVACVCCWGVGQRAHPRYRP